jgi:uncharacterized flavoprotein (TIGR03862 family)
VNPSVSPVQARISIVGGGPAGLHAAEVAAGLGAHVTLHDAKPSVGRKFLVAGKGGLNLTNAEDIELFAHRYSGTDQPDHLWKRFLAEFPPEQLRTWARGLGVETFAAKSGRVYLKDAKAAPLLRRWVERLRELGVVFKMNHRLTGIYPGDTFTLAFSDGSTAVADAVILALGGASWPRTGSDGGWVELFRKLGVSTTSLGAANCGWEHPWSAEILAQAEGKPLKNVSVRAGGKTVNGELLLTSYGLEGGPIYALGQKLREMPSPAIVIDFKPAHSREQLVAKMESVRRNFAAEARVRWKLGDAAHAILSRHEWKDTDSLAREAKNCLLPLRGPRPIEEAISTAGGVCWSELTTSLMVKKLPGLFVAGEMIDWEAPTGGYLLQGCFATGNMAARGAAAFTGISNSASHSSDTESL